MKILKIDHIGIATKSIDISKPFWTNIMGLPFIGYEEVKEQLVKTAFFSVGENKIELLESTNNLGPIAKYIKNKGEGIQHIAFRVKNITDSLKELKKNNINLINSKPKIGAKGAKIIFIHPKETGGILIELCER